jgi:uncharacterized protein (DUF3820 family)
MEAMEKTSRKALIKSRIIMNIPRNFCVWFKRDDENPKDLIKILFSVWFIK